MSGPAKWTPSRLTSVLEHCPAVLDSKPGEARADKRSAGAGIAAHEVFRARMDGRDVQDVCDAMATGRHRGQGYVHPDDVARGRTMADRWVERFGLPTGGLVEHQMAFDQDWRPVPYDSRPWLRMVLDMLEVYDDQVGEDEESYALRTARITDWKTGWSYEQDACTSLQMRAYAVAVLAAHPDIGQVILRIGNLARRQWYEETIWLDEHGLKMMAQWKADLDGVMRDVNREGPHVAVPGGGCVRCPRIHACADARQTLYGRSDEWRERARRYMVARAVVKALEGKIQGLAEHSHGARFDLDGWRLQYVEDHPRGVRDGATATAAKELVETMGVELSDDFSLAVDSLFHHIGNVSVAAMMRLANAVVPGKDDVTKSKRKSWLRRHVRTYTRPKWTVRRIDSGDA